MALTMITAAGYKADTPLFLLLAVGVDVHIFWDLIDRIRLESARPVANGHNSRHTKRRLVSCSNSVRRLHVTKIVLHRGCGKDVSRRLVARWSSRTRQGPWPGGKRNGSRKDSPRQRLCRNGL